MEKLGIYIHIPFCKEKCSYCDFYSGTASEDEKENYVRAVVSAIESTPYKGRGVDSIYFGGGTPSVLSTRQLEKILEKIHRFFAVSPKAEICLEANPESVSLSYLTDCKRMGFQRISFGIQSLNAKELSALGRIHTGEEGKVAVKMGKKAGFSHISVDAMLNIPFQTKESLESTLNQLTQLPIDHISAYMLQVEEGTPLSKSPFLAHLPQEDLEAELYLLAIDFLDRQGFSQYEISNFARKGGKSAHNLKYWNLEDYLGIGPSAHSFIDGKRFSFPPDRAGFSESGGDWGRVIIEEEIGGSLEEYIMLQLRLIPGLDLKKLAERYPKENILNIKSGAKPYIKEGYLILENDVITCTPKGFLFSNTIIGELIG